MIVFSCERKNKTKTSVSKTITAEGKSDFPEVKVTKQELMDDVPCGLNLSIHFQKKSGWPRKKQIIRFIQGRTWMNFFQI